MRKSQARYTSRSRSWRVSSHRLTGNLDLDKATAELAGAVGVS